MHKHKEKKPKLGTGKRFSGLAESIEKREGYSPARAEAAAASIGMKKYGKKRMAKLAAKGRKRAGRRK